MSVLLRLRGLLALLVVALSMAVVVVDHAEARRGGSFGSRGARTFQAPPPTATAPRQVQPVDRTMSTRPADQQTGALRPATAAPRAGGMFGGFGGGLLGGILAGGLLGMMFGGGFGGMAGFLGLIVQVALFALVAMLVMRFLRSRQSAPAMAGAGPAGAMAREAAPSSDVRSPRSGLGGLGGLGGATAGAAAATSRKPGAPVDEIGLTGADFDAFERLLGEVQEAYGREDFAALRQRTTPEILSYLSEELGQNATRGVKNEVSAVRLLQGDLAESWREGRTDYATVALRYESVDVTRDRTSGAVVDGDADHPTEVTELWTFTREARSPWKLSAIQEA